MSDNGVLTLSDVGRLAEILRATEGNRKVARVVDGDVHYGTARSIGDQDGNFDFVGDVRDQFLRVTLREGLEVFWPLRELMTEVPDGCFAEYDW